MALASGSHTLGRPQAGRPLTDDQDSEEGGRGLLGSEDVATTTFPSVLALREPGPLSPLGWAEPVPTSPGPVSLVLAQ